MAALGSIQMPCPVCSEGIGLPVQVAIGQRVGNELNCSISIPADVKAELRAHVAERHLQEA